MNHFKNNKLNVICRFLVLTICFLFSNQSTQAYGNSNDINDSCSDRLSILIEKVYNLERIGVKSFSDEQHVLYSILGNFNFCSFLNDRDMNFLLSEERNTQFENRGVFKIKQIIYFLILILLFTIVILQFNRSKTLAASFKETLIKKNSDILHYKKILDNINRCIKESKDCSSKLLKVKIKEELCYNIEDSWEFYIVMFNQNYPNVYCGIIQEFNTLSENECRYLVCIYDNQIPQNIAKLLGIKESSVRAIKWRIRKKLNISVDVDLRDYLLNMINKKTVLP